MHACGSLLGDASDRPRIPAVAVVRWRGSGEGLLCAQLLVELFDELLGLPVHLPAAVRRRVVPHRERRVGDPQLPHVRWGAAEARPQHGGRRREQRERRRLLLVAGAGGAQQLVVVVEDLEDLGNVGGVVVVPAGLRAVSAAVGAAAALAAGGDEAEGRVGRRGVAAAELHLARVVDGERGIEGAARERLRIRRRRFVVVVAVGGHELAEGLAGDLATVEEEVEVHGQLPLGHALADHEQHGAHHVPQPLRHVRLHHDLFPAPLPGFLHSFSGGVWFLR
uniref:Uncharacterized protein n=1 Tax=Arundo donax TaxID=35708 RepID=A0A0A8XN61_ARUDO